jgi:23S rRNA (guanosine2251-2'-O)-methyltransferase
LEKEKLIWGRNPVLEYLAADDMPSAAELLVADGAHGKPIDEARRRAKTRSVRTISVSRRDMDSLLPKDAVHQGLALRILGEKAQADEQDIITATAQNGGVLVLLDQLTDPHNIGSIVRSAEAFGAAGVFLPRAHFQGLSGTIVKTSAGATAHIPLVAVDNAARFLDRVKEAGVLGRRHHRRHRPRTFITGRHPPLLLVIGSEGEGMRRLTEEKCDYLVRIPLRGKVSSLNAAVAAVSRSTKCWEETHKGSQKNSNEFSFLSLMGPEIAVKTVFYMIASVKSSLFHRP